MPLPAASLALVNTVSDLISGFYANSTIQDLVNAEEIEIAKDDSKSVDLVIQASNQEVKIPVNLTIAVKNSRLVDGGLVNGKFDKSKISETLFETAQVAITPGKSISLVEALTTASDDKSKKTRGFLDALQSGVTYTKDDLAVRCGDLVAALDSFISKQDARAVFWSFLQRYGNQIDRERALGSGTLRSELTSLGLSI